MKGKGLIIILAVVLAFFLLGITIYNKMVTKEEAVSTAWGQVETQYQRRGDLIPNLVNIVKGYASHERETLEAVIEARSKASQTNIDPANLNEETLANFQTNQNALSQALGKLMVVIERYPDLKANENFLSLQNQLESTENLIASERKKFNDTAKGYNTYIRKVPNNIFAAIFGFNNKPYFKAQAGSEQAPKVEF